MNSDKTFDLAVAGELNLDLILYGLPVQMETERDLLATAFVSTLGSSSAIVAHNAAALGLRVYFATLVGDDDFGRAALGHLERVGIDTGGAIVDPGVTTGVTIVLPHGSERHSLTYLGAISQLRVAHLARPSLKKARHLHLCSLYLQTALHLELPELLCELKGAGLTLSLDTNDDPANTWGEPLKSLLPFIDLFMPSESELCRMAGKKDAVEAIATFAPEVPIMVVKRGKSGCTVRHHGTMTHVRGLAVEPLDTIGAGDSFNAGFLAAYLQGLDLAECGRAGNITGALSTLGRGGTEAFRNQALRASFLRDHGFPTVLG